MAEQDINRIIAGEHNGMWLHTRDDGYAYFSSKPNLIFDDHSIIGGIVIAKDSVESMSIINEKDGDRLRGAYWGGVAGALIAQEIGGYYLVEIKWADGETSLVKCAKGVYETMLKSSYLSSEDFLLDQAMEELKMQEEFVRKREEQLKYESLSPEEKKQVKKKRRLENFTFSIKIIGIFILVMGGIFGLAFGIASCISCI